MHFLADVQVRCPACHGTRYKSEILDIRYRHRSIADCLQMTVRQAREFFRGQPKVQKKLEVLATVGLDYLQLGQPATTLSAGEGQRLKLASFLSTTTDQKTLFLLDEPTTGLHFADVEVLIRCFDALLEMGHSLIVVEHNEQLMMAADEIIDIGPGAAERGGEIVAQGTPEQIMLIERSVTGHYLKELNR
jgi:excinuclease ABC subunit A